MKPKEKKFVKAYKRLCKGNVNVVKKIDYGSEVYEIQFTYPLIRIFKFQFFNRISNKYFQICLDTSFSVGCTPHQHEKLKEVLQIFSSSDKALTHFSDCLILLNTLVTPYLDNKNDNVIETRRVQDILFVKKL